MQPKTLTLILLAVFSFTSPLVEMLATGRVEMLSTYGLIETVIEVVLLFCWYHLDKAQHGYQAGRLMNAGVLVLAALALPIYFVRTRGWKRGGITIAQAGAFLLLTLLLSEAGEALGAWLRA